MSCLGRAPAPPSPVRRRSRNSPLPAGARPRGGRGSPRFHLPCGEGARPRPRHRADVQPRFPRARSVAALSRPLPDPKSASRSRATIPSPAPIAEAAHLPHRPPRRRGSVPAVAHRGWAVPDADATRPPSRGTSGAAGSAGTAPALQAASPVAALFTENHRSRQPRGACRLRCVRLMKGGCRGGENVATIRCVLWEGVAHAVVAGSVNSSDRLFLRWLPVRGALNRPLREKRVGGSEPARAMRLRETMTVRRRASFAFGMAAEADGCTISPGGWLRDSRAGARASVVRRSTSSPRGRGSSRSWR